MELYSFDTFQESLQDYEDFLPDADVADFVSASGSWILSAREAFSPQDDPFICRSALGWAPLLLHRNYYPGWHVLRPLECQWGYAPALVCSDTKAFVHEVLAEIDQRLSCRPGLYLSGLPTDGRADDVCALLMQCGWTIRGQLIGGCRRQASLQGGYDGWLSRRTRTMRKSLRQLARRAQGHCHVEVGMVSTQATFDHAWQRILAVETMSWKGGDEASRGLGIPEMQSFYRAMARRLIQQEGILVTFAYDDLGIPVGYAFGGLGFGVYRGHQISYDARMRSFGVGNLMQDATIRWLCENTSVHTYDLGGDMAYKRHWAERTVEASLIIAT